MIGLRPNISLNFPNIAWVAAEASPKLVNSQFDHSRGWNSEAILGASPAPRSDQR
jgi:hypothetical protein